MERKRLLQQAAGFFFILLIFLTPEQKVYGEIMESHRLTVKIPEILRLEVGREEIIFDLNSPKPGENYPAEIYPAVYKPTGEEYVTVCVYSNLRRQWQLKIKGENNREVPLEKVQWSLDETEWQSLSSQEQPVVSGTHTGGRHEFKVYYRLVLTGEEYPVTEYKVDVDYVLSAF